MLRRLPDGEPFVCIGVPGCVHLFSSEQPGSSRSGLQDSSINHAADARILGLGEGFSIPEWPLIHAVLFEPGESPACIWIVLSLLLGEVLVQVLVDELQRSANAHGSSIGLQDL